MDFYPEQLMLPAGKVQAPALISPLTQRYDATLKDVFGTMAMFETRLVVGLFSGGHDSLLSTYMVSQHPKFHGVVFADTGTGTGETIQYIHDTCARFDWKLVREPVHPLHYESLIVKHGFPSPPTHDMMYRELKDKPISKALTGITARTKVARRSIAQVTGLRRNESQRRMALIKAYHEKRNKKGTLEEYMINPLWDWTKVERDDMINHLGLPRNAYADAIGHSYECMCYANVSRGEREQRAAMSPIYEQIEQLREQMVATALQIQSLKFEAGMIDKQPLMAKTIRQGWHLDAVIKMVELEHADPFHLCAPCMSNRAVDGTGGYDPDMILIEATH